MKKEVTLGNLLSIIVPLFVLVLGWGISINSRLDVFDVEIKVNEKNIEKNSTQIEKVDDKIDKNFKTIQDKLDRILYRSLNN
tara:strand:+ start:692 stop:937 length:246 start_codon:yes stop_codon:yes gene_type:complete